MNKRIIYSNDDGGVAIIIPAACGLTIDEIAAKDVPVGRSFRIVDAADIPTDRTFRAALSLDLTHDINKSKAIAHDKRRTCRAAEFAPLDAKATIPSELQVAEAQRQMVRDKYSVMQAAIDSATTVDALKAVLVLP